MNEQAMTASLPRLPKLPVGYHAIHPDVSLNFQMNRWFGLVGDVSMLDEMRMVALRITTYADWQREFAALAQRALAKGQMLKAAYCLRSAEFFLPAGDPQRKPMREKFVQLTRDHCGEKPNDQHRVPYSRQAGPEILSSRQLWLGTSGDHGLARIASGKGAKELTIWAPRFIRLPANRRQLRC